MVSGNSSASIVRAHMLCVSTDLLCDFDSSIRCSHHKKFKECRLKRECKQLMRHFTGSLQCMQHLHWKLWERTDYLWTFATNLWSAPARKLGWCVNVLYLFFMLTKRSFPSQRGYPCLFWMAQRNHASGLTPNFGLTGYKTPYLLYQGGSKERETWLEESEAGEKSWKNERKGIRRRGK